MLLCFFVKQKTADEMRISDWSSDVCSSDLVERSGGRRRRRTETGRPAFDHAAAPANGSLRARISGVDADRPAAFGAAHVEQAIFIAILVVKGRRAGSW